MNKATYYLDLNNSFLISILIHLIILSLPLYYLPQTVKYVPIVNFTPVEFAVLEPVKTNVLYAKGKKPDIMKEITASRRSASNISPGLNQINRKGTPIDSLKNIEKKDFSRLDILDNKNSKITASKGTSFFPEDRKMSYSSENLSLKGSLDFEAGQKGEGELFAGTGQGDKLNPFSMSSGDDEGEENSFDFGGTIGKRGVRSKPKEKPNPEVDKEVTIMLKFWVTPLGQVFDVVPEKKGDAYLEKTAINYLRKWTFDPLPSNVSQENQWGIIPVRFRKK
ncbi:MAG: energy transducer TonB [bacterium]